MQKLFKRLIFILLLLFLIQIPFIIPQIGYKNKGTSKSIGLVNQGSIENAYKIPYRGKNFRYFSPFSYYVLGRCYVHSAVYETILESYKTCNNDFPEYLFQIMECSRKRGGRMLPHRTHQNGMSVDFMTPLVKNGKHKKYRWGIGIFSYALHFNDDGQLRRNKNIEIDFETMARHILILNDAARKNGLKVKKVIFKIDLKDNLFKTTAGKKLQERGIYFARYLPEKIDKLHDDHYHVDFEMLD